MVSNPGNCIKHKTSELQTKYNKQNGINNQKAEMITLSNDIFILINVTVRGHKKKKIREKNE